VIHEDRKRNRAYSLRWVGMEPGTAGYLAGLALARARNWSEFRRGLARYHVPGENIVYADTEGNIGWQAAGLMPVRRNWPGLFPVPGDTGEYEWSGFRPAGEMPYLYNPASHAIATANHNILPPGYRHALNYDWSLPFRHERVQEMLAAGGKFSVADFERMQQDVVSVAARRFQGILRKWSPAAGSRAGRIVEQLLRWDAALRADSEPALIYEAWIQKLPAAVFGPALAARTDLGMLLKTLEAEPNPKALEQALEAALGELGPLGSQTWGDLHRITFRHPLNLERFHRGPIARPGDAHTVNSTSGPGFLQTAGASYRQIMDLSDWDRSVMTNVPGESGDPESPHYSDLIEEWGAGKYHPMLYSRKAVEAATVERIRLEPR